VDVSEVRFPLEVTPELEVESHCGKITMLACIRREPAAVDECDCLVLDGPLTSIA